MADSTFTAGYAMAGNGTNLTPEYWLPALQDALPTYNLWTQFTDEQLSGIRLMQAGIGDTIRINYFDNVDVPSSSLTEGTFIARGTQNSTQVSLSLAEEGYKLDLSGLQEFATPYDLMSYAGNSMVKNSVQRLDTVIGAKFVAAANYFGIYGTADYYENQHTGTRGTEYVYPTHVRQLASRLARLGVEPWNIGGQMLYAWVAPPGAFEVLQQQSEFYESASRLGIDGPYKTGLNGVYGGFAFFAENGRNASTTYSATVGTSVIFGKSPCVGGNTLGGEDYLWYYKDVGDDAGRNQRVAWKFRQAYSLTLEGTTNFRTALVYHKM